MDRDLFERLVSEAMESLPAEFRSRIENVDVEVMQLAPPDVAESVGRQPWSLLGVYQGVPYNKRGPWYANVLPDRILIFQKPIERICRTNDEIRRMVRRVVIHEVGHYFGLSDDELRRLEAEADRTEAAGSGNPPSPPLLRGRLRPQGGGVRRRIVRSSGRPRG